MPQRDCAVPVGRRELMPAYGSDRPMTREELEERGFNPEVYIMTPRAYNWLKILSLAEDQNLRAELMEKYGELEVQLTYEDVKPIVEGYVTALENLDVGHEPLREVEERAGRAARPNALKTPNASRLANVSFVCSCGRNFSFAC